MTYVTPLLRFLRALTKEQRKQFATECGTTEVYLYQLAAQPAPNPQLKLALALVDHSKRYARRVMTDPDCLYVFPDQDGNAYGESAFKSMWARGWKDAIEADVVKREDYFNFHALRHYYVTEHKEIKGNVPNLHSDGRVTLRVYDETTEERRDAI
jgi:integrase